MESMRNSYLSHGVVRIVFCWMSILMISIASQSDISAQLRQDGVAVLQSSGRQPLSGVQVMAVGAAPVSSDDGGRFALDFRVMRAGDILMLNDIYKSGYSLVNEAALKRWRLTGENPVEVVLCPTESLLKRQEEYYGIGKNHYKNRYEAALAELQRLQASSALAEEEYEKRLEAIGKEYVDAMKRLDEYSYSMACINTDDLDDLEKSVYACLSGGDIDGAVAIMDRAAVTEKFTRLSAMGAEAEADLKSMIPSMRYYADICMFDGGAENLAKAREVLHEIALSDTTNYAYSKEYAEMVADYYLDYQEAETWLRMAMRHVNNDIASVEVITSLGKILVKKTDYSGASELFVDKGKDIVAKFQISENDDYLVEVAAEFFMAFSDLAYASNQFQIALEVLNNGMFGQYLYERNPQKYAYLYASMLSQVSSVMVESRSLSEQGLAVAASARKVFGNVPYNFDLRAAEALSRSYMISSAACNNIGAAYNNTGKYQEAIAYVDSAKVIVDKNESKNPIVFKLHKTVLLDYEGTLLMNLQKGQEAVAKFKEALAIFNNELPKYSGIPSLAQVYFHLSVCGAYIPDKMEWAGYAAKASEMYDRIAPTFYHPNNVGAYMMWIDALCATGQYDLAENKLADIMLKISIITDPEGKKLPIAGLKNFAQLAQKIYSGQEIVFKKYQNLVLSYFRDMLKHYPDSPDKEAVKRIIKSL